MSWQKITIILKHNTMQWLIENMGKTLVKKNQWPKTFLWNYLKYLLYPVLLESLWTL